VVEDHDLAGDGGLIEQLAGLAVQGVGDAQVEPDGGGAGERNHVALAGLFQRLGLVLRQVGQLGRAGRGVKRAQIEGDGVHEIQFGRYFWFR